MTNIERIAEYIRNTGYFPVPVETLIEKTGLTRSQITYSVYENPHIFRAEFLRVGGRHKRMQTVWLLRRNK